MKDFHKKIQAHISATTGAACFTDNATGSKYCSNNLTQQQAADFAVNNNLTLNSWHQGQSCAQVNC